MAELRIAANWEVSGTSIWGVTPLNARVRIADVTLLAPSNGVNWVQHANLIAAAPDMLAALRSISRKARALADDRDTHNRGFWVACADEADAAIAKAEGL